VIFLPPWTVDDSGGVRKEMDGGEGATTYPYLHFSPQCIYNFLNLQKPEICQYSQTSTIFNNHIPPMTYHLCLQTPKDGQSPLQ
jgi:hypothetical protein